MSLHNHQLTIGQLVEQAEQFRNEQFEVVHLSLDEGHELILALIVGENLDGHAAVLEGLHMLALEHARVRQTDELTALKGGALTEPVPVGVVPKPYGWVAVNRFFTDVEKAWTAAEKTSCVEVYSYPQMLAALNGGAVAEPFGAKPQTCNGKSCGWCREGSEPCHYKEAN